MLLSSQAAVSITAVTAIALIMVFILFMSVKIPKLNMLKNIMEKVKAGVKDL